MPEWQDITPSEFTHEREGLDWIRANLPKGYFGYSNFTFDGGGCSNEVDCLIAGPGGIFHVELKAHPGKIRLSKNDGWVADDRGRPRIIGANPRHLAERKTKRLKSILDRRNRTRVPFIETLVFFHNKEVDTSELPQDTIGICVQDTKRNGGPGLIETIKNASKAGLITRKPNSSGSLQDFVSRMKKIGIYKRNPSRMVGSWRLKEQVSNHDGAEDWLGLHADSEEIKARIRCYAIPPSADQEFRKTMNRRAKREFRVLDGLRHNGVERVRDLVSDGDRGPSLLYEGDYSARTLKEYVADKGPFKTEKLGDFLEQITDAVIHCHSRNVIHRSLSPESIYVEKTESPGTDRIELRHWVSAAQDSKATQHHHFESFDQETYAFRAPELHRERDASKPSVDVFSLGCLAFFMATGKTPPQDDLGKALVTTQGLNAHDEMKKLPVEVRTLVSRATTADPKERIRTATEFLHFVNQISVSERKALEKQAAQVPKKEPKTDSEDKDKKQSLTTEKKKPQSAGEKTPDSIKTKKEKRLGSGSAGTAWSCQLHGQNMVLKVANSASCDALIDEEAKALLSIESDHVVKLHEWGTFDGRRSIAVGNAGKITLGEMLRREIPLSEHEKMSIIEQLMDLACDLEKSGVIHGDLHPDHIGISAPPKDLSLRAFDFSLRPSGSAIPGSLRYTDPFFDARSELDAAADRYSIVAITHAVLVGSPPGWGVLGDTDPTLNSQAKIHLGSKIEPEYVEFFSQSLSRDIESRPSSARSLKALWEKTCQERKGGSTREEESSIMKNETSRSNKEGNEHSNEKIPECPKCSSPMTKRMRRSDGNPFWGCTTYPRCKGTRPASGEEEATQLAKKSTGAPSKPSPATQTIDLVIPHQVQSRHVKPLCVGSNMRKRIRVAPKSGMETAKCLLSQPHMPAVLLPPLAQNALTVVEKVLSRGIVSPLSPKLEREALKCITDENLEVSGTLSGDSMTELKFESEEEQLFVEKILVPRLGKEQMSCVTTQVNVSALTQQSTDIDRGERVDIVISDGGLVQVVVEIDGEQHADTAEYDASRDARLSEAGWMVIRISTGEARSLQGPNIDKVVQACVGVDPKRPKNITEDVLNRCAQAQVALHDILRNSPNESRLATQIDWPEWEGVDTKSLTAAVIEDFNKLVSDIGLLYETGMTKIEAVTDECEMLVTFRANKPSHEIPTWTIRDVHIPGRFLHRLSAANSAQPSNVDENALCDLLERIYGFSEFREGQFEAISRGLLGKDSIVLLPTGAGKSIVFQLTCILRPGPGIIVSPLIALMEDQVDNLAAHGISNVGAISSAGSMLERKEVHARLGAGSLLFAYVAPERFQMQEFRAQLMTLAVMTPISSIAIDEAHCVSEWGHDFRTSYLNIARNARSICSHEGRHPPLLALTGTASRSVLRDVQRELDIKDPDAVITPDSFDRKELQFRIRRCKSNEKSAVLKGILNKTAQAFNQDIRRFFTPNGEDSNCCVIFTPHTNAKFGVYEAASAAEDATGLNVGVYSGQAPKGAATSEWNENKKISATRFKGNETTILASTKAFGMGVDKPNIRSTVHFNIPASIESLYQEAGRAGRDRKDAICWVILSDDTTLQHPEILDPRTSIEDLSGVVDRFGYGQSDDVLRMLYFHTRSYKGIEAETSQILEVLESLAPVDKPHTVELSWDNAGSQSAIEKPLHRLLTVGAVSDYTIEYSKKQIRVDVRGASHEEIIRSLHNYLANFHRRSARVQSEELRELAKSMDMNAFTIEAARRLTEFIYEHVESSRRRALTETLRVCQAGIEDQEELRTRMLDYLQTSRFGKQVDELCDQDELDRVRLELTGELGRQPSESEITFELCKHVLDLAESCEDAIEAGHLRGEAARALTDFPDNPHLLLLRAFSECLSARPRQQTILEDAGKAMSLLSDELDDDSFSELAAAGLLLIESESAEIRSPLTKAFFTSMKSARKTAREWTSRNEKILQDAGTYYLVRGIRRNLDQVLGAINV